MSLPKTNCDTLICHPPITSILKTHLTYKCYIWNLYEKKIIKIQKFWKILTQSLISFSFSTKKWSDNQKSCPFDNFKQSSTIVVVVWPDERYIKILAYSFKTPSYDLTTILTSGWTRSFESRNNRQSIKPLLAGQFFYT